MGITVDEVAREGLISASKQWSAALQPLRQTISGLGKWAPLFVLTHLVIAAFPLASSLLLGHTVDALIGARGVGVMTSELTANLWHFGGLLLVIFASYLFTAKFTGQAAEAGWTLEHLAATALLLVGLGINERSAFLLVVLVGALLLSMYGSRLLLRLGLLSVVLLAAVIEVGTVLSFTVSRSFTVGEGLTIVALVAWSVVMLKLRLIRS